MKNSAVIILVIMMLFVSACGSSNSNADTGDVIPDTGKSDDIDSGAAPASAPEESALEDEEEIHSDDSFLPEFSYDQVLSDSGFDPLYAAAYDYLSFDHKKDHEPGNVIIPYVRIVDIDESDPGDVLVYGDYHVWEFERQDDKLVGVSYSHCPGVIHMQRQGEGESAAYSASGTMDEGFTDDDTKEIFGEYYDHYLTVTSDDKTRDSDIVQIISDYAAANDLDITMYEMTGEEPKDLPPARLSR